MKKINILTLLSLYLDVTYSAFVPPKHTSCTSPLLMTTRHDSSEEIQEAFRKSKEFGPDSKEAKVAWEAVEEIDASDNIRNAFEMNSPHSVGLTTDEQEYVTKINNLTNLLSNAIAPAIGPLRALISNLEDIETCDPKMTRIGGPLPEVLANALVAAKAADDVYGPSSQTASAAWNVAEQIAMDMNVSGYPSSISNVSDSERDYFRYKETAAITHHDYLAVVDPRCLEDATEALMKLEHLTRLMIIENTRLNYYFDEKAHVTYYFHDSDEDSAMDVKQ